jgi:hypothetical protein
MNVLLVALFALLVYVADGEMTDDDAMRRLQLLYLLAPLCERCLQRSARIIGRRHSRV